MDELNLAAPCGVYCGSCRHYLVLKKNQLKERGFKHGCEGCRIRNKRCAFIRKGCAAIRKNKYTFCYECNKFPCADLKKLDTRHRKNYGDSPVGNLKRIKEVGAEKWLSEQARFYRCPKCGGELSVHDDECFDCGFNYNPHKES